MQVRLFFLLFFISRGIVFADAIPPMPEMKCDLGARWGIDHGGGSCYPTYCQTNDQCNTGEVCQPQGLCVIFTLRTARSGDPYVDSSAYDTCDAKKVCSSGQCEVVKRCVPNGTKATPGAENRLTPPDTSMKTPDSTPTKVNPPTKVDKGRCAVSPVGELDVLGVLLFAFSLLLLRRRR
jgi:hypothetical protein